MQTFRACSFNPLQAGALSVVVPAFLLSIDSPQSVLQKLRLIKLENYSLKWSYAGYKMFQTRGQLNEKNFRELKERFDETS